MNSPSPSVFQRSRERIERGFSAWGRICYDHPWWIILSTLALVVYLSTYLPQMKVDMSTEGYLHKDDPARVVYDEFQIEFGRDERIVVLVESPQGVDNGPFLERLRDLHQELEKIPHVAKVDSLYNARLTYGEGDTLVVRDLLETWPESADDFAGLRERLITNPVYRKLFVNAALTRTLLIITPDTYASDPNAGDGAALDDFDFDAGFADTPELDARASLDEDADPSQASAPPFLSGDEVFAIVDAALEIKARYASADFQVGLAGSPYMMHQLTYVLGRDMFKFSFLGIFVIASLLFLLFRRWVMVILPVTVAALSMYFTFTVMAYIGMAATTSVQILPSLLLAVGVGNTVHIFTVFFQALDRGEDKRGALSYALGHSGFAVLMTGLTTAGGLISFISADMKPVSDIGIVSPMGIISTLLFSLILLPALIAVTPIRAQPVNSEAQGWLHRFLMGCAHLATTYPRRMTLAWFALMLICLFQVMRITPSHYPLNWFAPDSDLRSNTERIDADFGGATYMEIVVDTGRENGLHEPELLHAVDDALSFAQGLEVNGVRMGNATSLIDISKELHQALNSNQAAFYQIPQERTLVAQELLLFENSGSDDLKDIVDTTFQKMRVTIKMPFVDGTKYPEYLAALEAGISERIGDRAEVTFTGIVHVLSRTIKVLIGDTIRAYMLALLIISPLMMLLVGSVRTGLISMIPNIAPIIVSLALMPALGIPLDAFTLLIGSIALGLAVDDTIHFMHNYQRYYARWGDSKRAVQETMRTTGKALLITSLVLSCGFFINMFGTMINLQNFGLLTGICIIVAFLADALLAPALVTLLAQSKQKSRA